MTENYKEGRKPFGFVGKNEMSKASVGRADDRFGEKVEQREARIGVLLDDFRFSKKPSKRGASWLEKGYQGKARGSHTNMQPKVYQGI